MSKTMLPRNIDPIKFAQEQQALEGKLPLDKMARLVPMCHPGVQLGEAEVWIQGNRDIQGLPYLKGTVKATIPLTCQRCLERVDYSISTEFQLSPVHSEDQADSLPSSYEALILNENNEVSLCDLVEDELLLALPIVPKHKESECKKHMAKKDEMKIAKKKNHPFEKLRELTE